VFTHKLESARLVIKHCCQRWRTF